MNNAKHTLHPNCITGFVDGEGCFTIKLWENKSSKTGWYVQAIFQVGLHVRDKDLLLQFKSFFKEIGNIKAYNNIIYYRVIKIDDIIKIIIPHFEKYPLMTQKQTDFLLWKNIVNLIDKGEHLNKEGLIKVINLKASLNKGVSNKLKIDFPNTVKVIRSEKNLPVKIDSHWIAGFFSGEGCFFINICKATDYKIGYSINLQIICSQHSRDKILLDNLTDILKCGNVFKHSKRNTISLVISNFEDI